MFLGRTNFTQNFQLNLYNEVLTTMPKNFPKKSEVDKILKVYQRKLFFLQISFGHLQGSFNNRAKVVLSQNLYILTISLTKVGNFILLKKNNFSSKPPGQAEGCFDNRALIILSKVLQYLAENPNIGEKKEKSLRESFFIKRFHRRRRKLF